MDFGLGKRLTNLAALRQIGYTANRRLLAVQRLSHDPITGTDVLHTTCDPVIHDNGTRVAGLRFTDPRAQALLHILLLFRMHPGGFLNKDLRELLTDHLGRHPGTITPGQATYDLRRLREHGLIERIPHTHRYHVTDTGLRHTMFLTRIHDRMLRTGLVLQPHFSHCENYGSINDHRRQLEPAKNRSYRPSAMSLPALDGPSLVTQCDSAAVVLAELHHPTPTQLRKATGNYQTAIDDLTRRAGMAA